MRTMRRYAGNIKWVAPTNTGALVHVEVTSDPDKGREITIELPGWRLRQLFGDLLKEPAPRRAPTRKAKQIVPKKVIRRVTAA